MAWGFIPIGDICNCLCNICKTCRVSNLSTSDPTNTNIHLDCDIDPDSIPVIYNYEYSQGDTNSRSDLDSSSCFI